MKFFSNKIFSSFSYLPYAFCIVPQSLSTARQDDPKEDRSSDSVFVNTTHVVQSVIGLNNGLPFARSEDYPAFVKVFGPIRLYSYFL